MAIVSRHLLKSMWAGNLYLGPFEINERIRESVIIFKKKKRKPKVWNRYVIIQW